MNVTGRPRQGRAALVLLAALAAAACGSSSVTPEPTPSASPTPPPGPYVAVITSTGIRIQVVHVWDTRKVVFENQDSQPHAIYDDMHPAHTECQGKLNIGVLQPGERREVADLPFDACYFHDDLQPGVFAFTGVVVVH